MRRNAKRATPEQIKQFKESLRSGSRTTPSLVAHFLHERFLLRLPWERVSADLERDGLLPPPQMLEENARFYYGFFTVIRVPKFFCPFVKTVGTNAVFAASLPDWLMALICF